MTRNNDIKEAKEELDRLNGDYEIQRLAELREKAIRDEASRIYSATQKAIEQGLEQGREQGLKQGLQQGREEGKKEEKILIAKRLLQLGISVSDIAKTTDLTEEEVVKLK